MQVRTLTRRTLEIPHGHSRTGAGRVPVERFAKQEGPCDGDVAVRTVPRTQRHFGYVNIFE